MKAEVFKGVTWKFWGLEMSVDFYDGVCLFFRIGPFYFGLSIWRDQ
jgi:hypothetical protein